MADDLFDAIIVGGGLAGGTAAYVLAKAGCDVLVVERGNFAGSKNMTGGRLYSHSLEAIIPGFADEAPVERRVTREKISMLTDDGSVTLDYQSSQLEDAGARSYTVLRSSFDQWLMGKAEEAGAQVITGVRVDELIVKDGKVCGVKAGDDEIEARAVILADGVNSLLAKKLGMTQRVNPHTVAVGVKELLEFTPEQMEARFGCSGDEGLAWLFAGTPSGGHMGGGFLYTNKNTVSLGLVLGLHNVDKFSRSVPQMLEDFKHHPAVAPLIKDGKLLEYSAHMVPEGGMNMVSELVGNGVVVAGDAAGFCLNVGYTVRGMDLAIASGEAAAKAVLLAKDRNDFSRKGLEAYRTLLDDSFVMKDMRLYKDLPAFLDNSRFFVDYPAMAAGAMRDMFVISGPERPLRKKLISRVKKVGVMNLIKDGFKGVRAI
ncbi:oxidoreductase FixC [Leminorella grimontii]|uniref:Protein FixC n=1 Tax=Leminorella grimontii TaxID=82981 RepID=A0AAV5N6N2_9GAMM|nr:FAD-dependent oxidoreductase [Leminorella grimontii]KFC92836.1 putative electron transfer flavoprotein-quinone oxidoreductase [Leminorella grimontii ATCC 33999 = DSM 5078]GKX56719.1 oxidoreductase FixC [Leminorella grimontii]VFS62151.1 Electron transfer flavoprotein-ubiquinone oxidoreductase [Leminorella grimontii]